MDDGTAQGLAHHAPWCGGGDGLPAADPLSADLSSAEPDPQQIARTLTHAGIGVFQCDLSTQGLRWTRPVYEIFGLDPMAPLHREDVLALYDEESRAVLDRVRSRALDRRSGFTLDARIKRTDGQQRWVQIMAQVESTRGSALRLVGTKQDITEQRERWDALQRSAERDSLTGLANRAVFQSRFLDSARTTLGFRPLGALVLFDVDGFKQINDRYGHAVGDACLVQFGERIRRGFPDALLTARIGGDEFAVLLPSNRSLQRVNARVVRVAQALKMPIVWNDILFEAGACHGIALAHNAISYDAEEMFVRADLALYAAKRARPAAR